MADLAPGTRVGPYVIRKVAGRGAVGVVYAADHEQLDRRVAIKTLNTALVGEETYRVRFQREAEGAARFDHPNIINVFDAGEFEGAPYLVMTYVTGPDLEQVLSDRGGKLEPAETILICAAVAAALDAAGAEGLAHRDVKPANIMLEGWAPERYGGRRRRPHVYLTDFGLIKSSAQATLTKTGQFVGTLLYMSPEQVNAAAVPASDQYSLACVMWECLTGDYPFRPTGNSMLSLINAHLTVEPPSIVAQSGQRWPSEVDRVFRRALAKDPAERFATCTHFVDHATRALGLGASAPQVTPAPPLSAVNTTAELDRRRQAGVSPRDPVVRPPSLADLPPVPLGDHPVQPGQDTRRKQDPAGSTPGAARGTRGGGRTGADVADGGAADRPGAGDRSAEGRSAEGRSAEGGAAEGGAAEGGAAGRHAADRGEDVQPSGRTAPSAPPFRQLPPTNVPAPAATSSGGSGRLVIGIVIVLVVLGLIALAARLL